MTLLLRRSAAIRPSAPARSLAALLAGDFCRHFCVAPQQEQSPAELDANLDLDCSLHSPDNPEWFEAASELSRPEGVVSSNWDEEKTSGKRRVEETEIAKLFISPEIVSRLAKRGITRLFPVQRAVLGPALQGRDMICRAKTGTGKTLAYGIPIMDKIMRSKATPPAKRSFRHGRSPLALVITPTRELARQVEKEFRESSPLKTMSVYGGVPFLRQLNDLNYGVDVLVGTPGRINDLIGRNALNLLQVQFVVLDESDEMLTVSFAEIVEKIFGNLPRRRQSILFSSTMPSWIKEFQSVYLNDPFIIDLVGAIAKKLPEGIVLYSIASNDYQKPSIIVALITEHAKAGKCVIFTQSTRNVDKLSSYIGRSFRCESLHSNMQQSRREKTLASFHNGYFNILVATDVAARGLDIPNVDLIIHYELPTNSELFIHRTGRTGRAGRQGTAILIYSEEQIEDVRKVEQDVGCTFKELPRITVEEGDQLMLADTHGSGFDSSQGSRSSSYKFSRFGSSGAYDTSSSASCSGNNLVSRQSRGRDQFSSLGTSERRELTSPLGGSNFTISGSSFSIGSRNPGFRHSGLTNALSGHLGYREPQFTRSGFGQSDHTTDSGHTIQKLSADDSVKPESGILSGFVGSISGGSKERAIVRHPSGFCGSSSDLPDDVSVAGSRFGSFSFRFGDKGTDSDSRKVIESGMDQCSDLHDSGSQHADGFTNSNSSLSHSFSGFGSFSNNSISSGSSKLNDLTNIQHPNIDSSCSMHPAEKPTEARNKSGSSKDIVDGIFAIFKSSGH